MQGDILKKNVKYKDKDGAEKNATNFYIRCGNVLIPIEVKYFPDKETGIDKAYNGRKSVLLAFAEELPDKG